MSKLFGVNVSGLVHKHISPGLFDATLIKITEGTRDPADLAGGTRPTSASYACRGFEDSYEQKHIDGTLVHKGDRKILLIGDSIAGGQIPEPGDRITIAGATYVIVGKGVDRDPASAAYVCQGRSV